MNRTQKTVSYLAGQLALLLVLAVFMGSLAAGAEESTVVRIAYPLQTGITDLDENGAYTGYTYEYLEEIAQYTGWDYEFVQVPGDENEQLSVLLDMVRNGEVDFIGSMLYSEQMAVEFDYGGYSCGTVETVLQTLAVGQEPIVIDASRMQTIRIAVYSTSGRLANDLYEFCRVNRIEPIFVECTDDQDMLNALREGRADVLLNTSMNYIDGLHTIARFSSRPFYFITSKNNSRNLLPQLNEAMASINQIDPYYQNSLYETYFTPSVHEFRLSEKETAYIEQAGPLTVGVLSSRPPYQYKADGMLKGIGVDLLQYIAEQTGLSFTLKEAGSEEELYQMAASGAVDLIAEMPYQYETARDKHLSMTRPYASCPYTLLLNERMSASQINGKRLAMPAATTYHGYVVGNVVTFDSVDDCIRAVNSGDADYTYVDSFTAQYYNNLTEFSRLKMVPQTYKPYRTCFAIAASADHTILDILNKAILSIPAENLQSIYYANTVNTQPFSLGVFIQKNPVPVILILSGIFLLLFLLLLVILYLRSKASKAMELELQKHQRLYAISNDTIFEYDYKTRHLVLNVPGTNPGEAAAVRCYDLNRPCEGMDKQKSMQIWLDLLNTRKSCVCEERLVGFDGEWHWVRMALETICDALGKPVYAIGKINIVDKERSEKDALLDKAQRDSLTHLYNIESSRKQIEGQLALSGPASGGAMLLLDIDSFKSINDTYGHMRGDQILRETAELLQRTVGNDDIVGRPGGDEFLIYLAHIQDRDELSAVCETICGAVRQIRLDGSRHPTVSIGAVLAVPGLDYDALYQIADRALYAAKDAGRDGYRILSETPTETCRL